MKYIINTLAILFAIYVIVTVNVAECLETSAKMWNFGIIIAGFIGFGIYYFSEFNRKYVK